VTDGSGARPGGPPANGEGLPRRDFILIPLLSLLSIVVMLLVAEIASRQFFVESGVETCSIDDPSGIPRMKPNCISYRKAAEGPEVQNAFNDCGYRTAERCHPRPAGARRVAVMGASTAEGFKIRYEESFAARLTAMLGAACDRAAEFQNMGIAGTTPLDSYRRMDEALAMDPDLVMLVLSPYDMKARFDPVALAARDDPPTATRGVASASTAPAAAAASDGRSLVARLSDIAASSRALIAAQHFLFQDRPTYVRLFMLHGEDAGYLRPPFGPGWEERLRDMDLLLGAMARRAAARGVPMMLVMGPQRIQAALLSEDARSYGADPYAIGQRLGEIAKRHGIFFLDALDAFATLPAPERFFYPWDGHMDAAGSAVFADAVFRRLTAGDIKPFAACRRAPPPDRRAALP